MISAVSATEKITCNSVKNSFNGGFFSAQDGSGMPKYLVV